MPMTEHIGSILRSRTAMANLLVVLLLAPILSGCTSVMGPPDPSARMSADRTQVDAGDSVNFDARETSTPDGTMMVSYRWHFGDGIQIETVQGYTSHTYDLPGVYEVAVTAVNDQGGEDSTTTTIFVNGFPEILLSMPVAVRTGDVVVMDASSSFDPEGGVLTFQWDFDWSVDSDNDGDPKNDVDMTGSEITITPAVSGEYSGSLTVIDDKEATVIRTWTINVLPRTWQVIWEEHRISLDWNGYLDQGDSHTILHFPSEGGRLYSVNATLTLEMDILPFTQPQDNFSLTVTLANDGWTSTVRTQQENVTRNSTASIERNAMNTWPEARDNYTADSLDQLMEMLLNETGHRFGQGQWQWVIVAEEADPDFLIDDMDPDGGNNWELEIVFTMLVPRISEVGV